MRLVTRGASSLAAVLVCTVWAKLSAVGVFKRRLNAVGGVRWFCVVSLGVVSLKSFVVANFEANELVAMPILYKLA